ncbi:MAG: DEAD/DEAH box helicase, partial [Nitrospirae bacterium]|nr:DEAD/DEAH box helicase [Nitrospirota bacterium]
MPITDFIESLEKDKRFTSRIAEHKYIHPLKPGYRKIDLHDKLRDVLKGHGIELFYSHQVEAIDLIRQGENVVVMTPTASGKSLIYNIPVIEAIIENPGAKALYIFPLKGLEQDQVKNLNVLFNEVGISHPDITPPPPSYLTNKTISKAPSPSPSPAGGEGKNIAPPLRGGDKGEGDLCGFTNELLS